MAVVERPILFSSSMVRAVLAGAKTITRRVIKRQPPKWVDSYEQSCSPLHWLPAGVYLSDPSGLLGRGALTVRGTNGQPERCPYGAAGDRLWVRETWACKWRESEQEHWEGFAYRADHPEGAPVPGGKWRPSIFMPSAASRITLEITNIRAEKLQSISAKDARAEGIPQTAGEASKLGLFDTSKEPGSEWDNRTSVQNFARLWDSINGKKPGCDWAADPFVWVVSFARVDAAAAGPDPEWMD